MSRSKENPPSEATLSAADVRHFIANHPFTKGWAPSYLDLMSSCARIVRFNPGDLIFKQGDAAKHFYLIMGGMVSLTHAGTHGNVAIQNLEGGSALGWSWLFPPYAWHFNAMVLENTLTIQLDGARLKELAKQHPEFGYNLMYRVSEVVIERLQTTRRRFLKYL